MAEVLIVRAKKDIIKLDTTLVDVIQTSTYVSELGNGHRLVAVADGRKTSGMRFPRLSVGDRVEVAVCPGDMARGWVVRKLD